MAAGLGQTGYGRNGWQIYHAIFSITIPIFLVELTFPQSKTRIWLSSKMRLLFHGLLILAMILGFFALFFDFILDLFLGRIGTSVLGVSFMAYLLWIRKKILLQLPLKPSSLQLGSGMPEPTEPGAR